MRDFLLRIYDSLLTHRPWLWGICAAIVLLLAGLAISLRYHENIMDFLPVDEQDKAALEDYQSRQDAARLVLIIEGDESLREEALDEINYQLSRFDLSNNRAPQGLRTVNYQLSTDPTDQLIELYSQLPYLIADSTYARFDSLFTPAAVRNALLRDKAILNTPGTGFLAPVIQSDPLGLAQMSDLKSSISGERTYAFLTSPYGATETQRNAALLDTLNRIIDEVQSKIENRKSEIDPHQSINARWIGAPVISVSNARRIKTDTALCIALSLVLIIALLTYAFPRKRDIGLILLAVSFGWLTGMAVLRIVTPAVSAIVLGIGSVLIGIAVNYPLHLLVHQRYTSSVRQTLDEVLSPLVVGNITTVGAFMALIPLQSTALRHLGIFAAAMLIGTILFCIFVMPHMMSAEPTPVREIKIINRQSTIDNRKSSIVQSSILLLTLLFAAYLIVNHQSSIFNCQLSTINYMTDQQRADMAAFDIRRFDAAQWTTYWQSHDPQQLIATIRSEAEEVGFKPDAFAPFYDMLTEWQPASVFDFSKLTQGLSDNFDYIGLCCSLIVFVFLFLTFAFQSSTIENRKSKIVNGFALALIAFIPMALSWVWILAIMKIFGLQFNIVNIILATFIFGQGDDYTIFIVEGLIYEYKTKKTILPQYRQSILLSALIMLVGIGILVLAVHPAMHSLGVITLIGMVVVLLMAITIPPVLFRLYVRKFPV